MIQVLLVEDDEVFINKIKEATNNTDYKIIAFKTGLQAIEYFETSNPDIALIDIELDNSPINGIAVAEYIIYKKRIPFGFITRHISEKSVHYIHAQSVFPTLYYPKTAAIDTSSILHVLNDLENKIKTITQRHPKEKADIIPTNAGVFVAHKKDTDRLIFLAREEIILVEAFKGVCKVYPDTSKQNREHYGYKNFSYLVHMSLQNLLDILSTPLLIQLHRKYAVNIRLSEFEPITNMWRKVNYTVHVQSSNVTFSFKVGSTFKDIAKHYAKNT